MTRTGHIARLLHLIAAYRLEDRFPAQIRPIVLMAEHGMLSEEDAEALRHHIRPFIEAQKDFPNLLHRLPTEEQYGDAAFPDAPLGSLVEELDLAFGLRILDRPRHVLIAGSTGSGKTTAIRLIIRGIDRLNQELADQETPGTRTDSEDAGHSSTP